MLAPRESNPDLIVISDLCKTTYTRSHLEEPVGFEPTEHVPALSCFRDSRLNPLSHSSRRPATSEVAGLHVPPLNPGDHGGLGFAGPRVSLSAVTGWVRAHPERKIHGSNVCRTCALTSG